MWLVIVNSSDPITSECQGLKCFSVVPRRPQTFRRVCKILVSVYCSNKLHRLQYTSTLVLNRVELRNYHNDEIQNFGGNLLPSGIPL